MVRTPVPFPVIAYPAAWSPGIDETEADVVYLDVKKVEDFDAYKGKLKGKYVLLSAPAELKPHFEPQGLRLLGPMPGSRPSSSIRSCTAPSYMGSSVGGGADAGALAVSRRSIRCS